MMRVLFLKWLPRAGLSICLVLALLVYFAIGSVQAADSGPRRHAEGQYDAASGIYTVTESDDLDTIAERFGVSVTELKTLNKLESDLIEVGQKLIIATTGALGSPRRCSTR